MNDFKEILVSIRDVLLEMKEEQRRANELKEVELGILSETKYIAERNIKRLKRGRPQKDE